jgi:hypothetical protein
MADISDVNAEKIKDLYEKLESLSCKIRVLPPPIRPTNFDMHGDSPGYDPNFVLGPWDKVLGFRGT